MPVRPVPALEPASSGVPYGWGMSGPGQRMRRSSLAMRLSGMSGRRRALGAGLAVIVLAAAVIGVVAGVTHSRGTGQPGSAAASEQQAGPAQNRPGPVLLVPGYGGSTSWQTRSGQLAGLRSSCSCPAPVLAA
jgi:hypothetical protein